LSAQIKIVKKDSAPNEVRAKIPADGMRDYLMLVRSSLIQQLSALEKLLGLNRRCKHCGNDL
jgi:hypothetical protein